MSKVPTVRIEAEDGFIVINESDYDSDTMELVTVKKERTTPPTPDAVTVEEVADAIREFDEEDDSLWTDAGVAKTTVLSEVLDKPVSANMRDEATALIEKE